MELTIIEHLVIFYWFLLDIRAFQDYQYWVSIGVLPKYALERVKETLSRGRKR